MAVSSTESKKIFNATGGTTYAFPYDFLADEDNLVVYYEDSLGETITLVLTTDYTVAESTGVVTTVATYTSGKIIIVRDVTATQTFDVTTGDGFQPDDLEHALDKTVMLVQENERRIDGALVLADSDTVAPSTILPTPEALNYLRWNAANDAIENADATDIATAVQASAWIVDTFTDGVDWTSGVTTDFTLSANPGPEKNTLIYLDGLYQHLGLYTVFGALVSFAVAPVGTILEVKVITAAESQSQTQADSIQFNTSPTGITDVEGLQYWNNVSKTMNIVLAGGVVMQVGQEIPLYVKNTSGVLIADGKMAYMAGSTGVNIIIGLADASDLTKCSQIGMVTTPGGIAHNGFGFVTRFGAVRDVDTSSFTEGNTVYLSATTPGDVVATAPGTPHNTVEVGSVIRQHATQGVFGVDPKQPHAADVALGGGSASDLVGPTQKAVKNYVDTTVAALFVPGVLYQDTTTRDHTGDTDETDLATYTLPGGTLSANGGLRVTIAFDADLANDAATFKVYWGSATILTLSLASDTDTQGRIVFEIFNTASASFQRHSSVTIVDPNTGTTVTTAPTGAGTQATASDVIIKTTGQLVNSGDTINNEIMLVEHISE